MLTMKVGLMKKIERIGVMNKLIKLLEQMDADFEDRWIAVIAILMVIVWILGVHFQWI